MNLNRPVATVLGASGGMGHSLVRELVKEGYRVRAVARNGDRLNRNFRIFPLMMSKSCQETFPGAGSFAKPAGMPMLSFIRFPFRTTNGKTNNSI
jgi:NAD(P)-dependent dehydrogenase (short-subunit alcohol dehydrogenase family)